MQTITIGEGKIQMGCEEIEDGLAIHFNELLKSHTIGAVTTAEDAGLPLLKIIFLNGEGLQVLLNRLNIIKAQFSLRDLRKNI